MIVVTQKLIKMYKEINRTKVMHFQRDLENCSSSIVIQKTPYFTIHVQH